MEESQEIEIKLKVNSHSFFLDVIKEFANDFPDIEAIQDRATDCTE